LYGTNTTNVIDEDIRKVNKTLNFNECMFDDSDSDMQIRERAQSFLSSDGGFIVEDLESSSS